MSNDLKENLLYLEQEMGIGTSYDVIAREVTFAGRDMAFVFIDGFAKDDVMLFLMQGLSRLSREDIAVKTIDKLVRRSIPYIEVETVDTLHAVVDAVLPGSVALLVDGEDTAIIIDARQYPARGPEEPDIERTTRGSRDGFVETIVFNTALIRRRVRDPKLRIEMMTAGTRSKTDIAVIYIMDIANPKLVEDIKKKIKRVKIDGLPMADKSLEEFMVHGRFNLFPRVRYTERPDVAAAHLFEGHIVVVVDTSPSVMILPATWFHHIQHAEEYRSSPGVGLYIRWVRFSAIIVSVLATPVWLLVATNPGLLPEALKFIGPEKVGPIPLWLQFFLAEIGIDAIRMAAIHTPSPLATALGLIAAFMIGDVAIQVGLFAQEVILYMAVAAVGTFATPSFELANANRIVRLGLLLSVALFGLPGLVLGLGITFVSLALAKSFGVPYLWPLFPLNWGAMKEVLFRRPVPMSKWRPSALKTQDRDRQP